jgi:hypothetical protein
MKPSLDFPLVGHCVGLAAVLAIVAVTSAADPYQTVVLGDSLAAGVAPPTLPRSPQTAAPLDGPAIIVQIHDMTSDAPRDNPRE